MYESIKKIAAAIAILVIFNFASAAQQPSTPAPKSNDDFVTEKGFKSMVFDVKYRDTDSLARVLQSLGSGFKGASISPNFEFKTLTVRDFPENLTAIEDALKRLDTPQPPRANIELHMHVLIASNGSPAAAALQPPAELKDVLTQLRETLSYRNYEMATSIVQRLTETPRTLGGSGMAQISGSQAAGSTINLSYFYNINTVSLASTSTGAPTVQIGDFVFTTSMPQSKAGTRVQTALNLRDGEKVVVGTSAFLDRALIIVITATLVK